MDVEAINWRAGVVGSLGIAVTIAVVGLLGPAGLLAGLGALVLGVLDEPGPMRARLARRARVTALAAGVVLVLSWVGPSPWAATVAAAAVTFAASLACAWGQRAAAEGQLIVLLVVVTLMVASADLSSWTLAAAVVIGGTLSTVVALAGSRWDGDDAPGDTPGAGPSPTISQALRSKAGTFAAVRSAAVAVATAAGYTLFESHPVWALLTLVVVLQPPPRQTVVVGLQRTAGTLVGVLIGLGLTHWLDGSEGALLVAFMAAAFAMMTVKDASYTLSTACITVVLLVSQRILDEDADAAGLQRMAATVLGTALAWGVVAILMAVTAPPSTATTGPTR